MPEVVFVSSDGLWRALWIVRSFHFVPQKIPVRKRDSSVIRVCFKRDSGCVGVIQVSGVCFRVGGAIVET